MKAFVSILIPAKNEEENIGKCLKSVTSQDYPPECFEIIVMDNGSTDATKKIVATFGVRILDAKDLSIGGVRNTGAKESKGEILAYLDADCVANTDWLTKGTQLLMSSERVGAVGGPCHVSTQSTWVQKAWGWKHKNLGTSFVDSLSTGSFFVKKSVFYEVGGFNDSLAAGEDTEISRKIIASKRTLLFSSCIGVVHLGYPRSLKDFIKRQVWQSSDYLQTIKSKKDEVFLLVHLFVLSIILGIFLSIINGSIFTFGLFFGVSFILAVLLAVYRHMKLGRGWQLKILIQSFFLNYLYLLGRSIGLLKSYFHLISRFLSLV